MVLNRSTFNEPTQEHIRRDTPYDLGEFLLYKIRPKNVKIMTIRVRKHPDGRRSDIYAIKPQRDQYRLEF